jgi:hypothetical protein
MLALLGMVIRAERDRSAVTEAEVRAALRAFVAVGEIEPWIAEQGVAQIKVTPKTRNPFTLKALSTSGVTWSWHVLLLRLDLPRRRPDPFNNATQDHCSKTMSGTRTSQL